MTLIYFLLILGIMIFVHELGHFVFAKKCGMYVHEFALGMGPKIFSFTRKNDETIYSLRLLPIGGFCAIAGEDNDMAKDKKVDKEKLFNNKSFKDKFLVLIAGAMFNFICALIILFVINLIYGARTGESYVSEKLKNYPAYESNLEKGDIIHKVNGKSVNSLEDIYLYMEIANKTTDTIFSIENKNGDLKEVKIKPKYDEKTEKYMYGIAFNQVVEKGFLSSIKYTFVNFKNLILNMGKTLINLVNSNLEIENMSGPIGVYKHVETIETDDIITNIANMAMLTALLSINVGFINLLPIPALDGGRLVFLIFEKILGKKINSRLENVMNFVFFILLMALMVVVTYNDILKL
ncbi:MAG: M50 family metallopeptidase [Bacilli bacterium]